MNDNICVQFRTLDHPYQDIFKYEIIDSNQILVKRDDVKAGWWLNLNVEITYHKDIKQIVNIGNNMNSYFKIVLLEFDLYDPKLYLEYVSKQLYSEPINDDINLKGVMLDSETLVSGNIILSSTENIALISSIIYATGVNIIQHDNRYEQTIRALKSVIKHIPNVKIILLEQSKNLPNEKATELLKYCNYLLRYMNDELCDYYSNKQSYNKGLGEMYVTNHFLNIIKNKEFGMIYKLVGRYILTDDFNINEFDANVPTFKAIKGNGCSGEIVFSNFYTIPKKYLNLYLEHQKIWFTPDRREPIEHILTMFFDSIPGPNIISKINMIGVSGQNNRIVYF